METQHHVEVIAKGRRSYNPYQRAEHVGSPATPAVSAPLRSAEPVRETTRSSEIATIGKSVVVKGELSGSEDLVVDGEVEGSIALRGQSLTIGPNGRVRANIEARNVILHGRVDGDIHASDRVELRKSASLSGDITTARISIEDGAFFKGTIDIQKPEPAPKIEPRPQIHAAAATVPAASTFIAGIAAGAKEVLAPGADRHGVRCRVRRPANFRPCNSTRAVRCRRYRKIDGRTALPIQWCAVAPGIFSKIFGGSGRQGTEDEFVPGEKIGRRSTGFNEFIRAISREEGLKVLDLGSTSPANITFMTGLGHKFHQEDVLRSATDKSLVIPNGDGGTTIDVHRYFDENLDFEREEFDAVMFWDLADFLPEPLVKPLIERIQVAMKPGGILFAFFHTKDAGPDAPFYRYNIASKDTLELQPARAFRLQRIFNNRHVENLFREYSSIKFFLGRDNIREVLVIR